MQRLIVAVAIVAVCGSAPAQKPSQAREIVMTQKVELIAEPVTSRFTTGEPVEIRLRLRNRSKDSVDFTEFGAEFDYAVVIGDEAGHIPQKTEFGAGLFKTHVPISAQSQKLPNGQEITETLDLSHLYNFTPGVYEAYVSRSLRPVSPEAAARVDERVYSNRFKFTTVAP